MKKKANLDSGLLPQLRFPDFIESGAWDIKPLKALAKRRSKRNTGEAIVRVLTNSAEHGIVDQRDYFDKDIATKGNLETYFIVAEGDFVYNPRISNLAPVGPIHKNKIGMGVMSPLYTVFRFDNDFNEFYEYYFRSNHWHQYLRLSSNTGARHDRMAIANGDFFEMPLPAPDLAEQKKIAGCLSSLDALIAAEAAKLSVLNNQKIGLIQQLLPVDGESKPRLRFPEFHKSKAWIEKPLGEIVTYENGKAYEPHIVESGKYVVVNARFISTDGAIKKWSNSPILIADKDDVLMVLSDLPNGKALAKCYRVEENNKYAVNQRICRLKPHSIRNDFLFFILDRNRHLLSFNDGMNQTHLSKDNVLKCPILYPEDAAEQHKIASCLSSIDAQISAVADKLEALKGHSKGLLQQLFPSCEEVGP